MKKTALIIGVIIATGCAPKKQNVKEDFITRKDAIEIVDDIHFSDDMYGDLLKEIERSIEDHKKHWPHGCECK